MAAAEPQFAIPDWQAGQASALARIKAESGSKKKGGKKTQPARDEAPRPSTISLDAFLPASR
jgi:hypothetical protein